MKILVATAAEAARAALRVVILPEGNPPKISGATGEIAAKLLRRKEWTAKFRSTVLLYGKQGDERLLLVGLGPAKEVDAEKVRRAAALAHKKAKGLKLS
ncbi:MAG: M17 family peptidase N-terminal domain-containing protein, partial [Planctomycetota bacterium]